MTQPRAPKRPQSWDRSLPSWLLAAWAVTGVLLALLAVFWIRRGEDAVEAEWQSRLTRLADDRLAIAERAVEAWKVEARLLSRLAAIRQRAARARAGASGRDAVLEARVREELDELAQDEPGMSVSLVDRSGRVLQSSSLSPAFAPAQLETAKRAVRERQTA